jgi:NAD-dependent dihydropyrimidine dehydrogenase PreA subunit
MFIDPDECVDCGACLPVCPADAIYADRDVPAEDAAAVERNARFFSK